MEHVGVTWRLVTFVLSAPYKYSFLLTYLGGMCFRSWRPVTLETTCCCSLPDVPCRTAGTKLSLDMLSTIYVIIMKWSLQDKCIF